MPMDIRKLALGLGAFAAGAAAFAFGARRFGSGSATGTGDSDGHVPTDLMKDEPVRLQDRAIEAFRPDPLAVPTAEEREALRPATGPVPSLANARGTVAASSGA